MAWTVAFHEEFDPEFEQLDASVQDELLARAKLLEQFGPTLGRPWADTLKGSRHANMKELRFEAAGGVWRVTFAFDAARQAVLLVAGDKTGQSHRRFYTALIGRADDRFDAWLAGTRKDKDDGRKSRGKAGKPATRPARQGRGARR
ncbi:MAG: type II toxin-antitoxin system RelE/ParE family toxin [Geminicoccales bacterium]